MNRRIEIFIILLLFFTCGFVFFIIYKNNFKSKAETKNYVNEIVTLKVDSCTVYEGPYHASYKLYISDKYLICIDSIKHIPFEREERVDFCVKDKNLNYIIADWKKYWQEDIDKLLEYTTKNIKSFNK